MDTSAVLKYLEAPDSARPAAEFDPERLLPPLPFFLSPEQSSRLAERAIRTAPFDQRAMEKLLIDLSWASSHLEGNTYTQLDTLALIESNQKTAGKPEEDAVMILNHKRAIEKLHPVPPLNRSTVTAVHSALSDMRHLESSRHFVEPKHQGVLREYGEIRISGSSYFPAADLGPKMAEHLDQVLQIAEAMTPFNAMFYLLTRLPYLQPFMDVNKRTSRLVANIPLMRAGLQPLTYVGVDRSQYHKAIVAFYELGHETLFRNIILESYGMQLLRGLAATPEQRVAVTTHRATLGVQFRDWVLEGKQAPALYDFLSPADMGTRSEPREG